MPSIDAPLIITCSSPWTCDDCLSGDSTGAHRIRCGCGKPAIELISADALDVRWSIGACRTCLELAHADAPTGVRYPASVTQRGENPVFVSVACTECGAQVVAGDPADSDQCSQTCRQMAAEREAEPAETRADWESRRADDEDGERAVR